VFYTSLLERRTGFNPFGALAAQRFLGDHMKEGGFPLRSACASPSRLGTTGGSTHR